MKKLIYILLFLFPLFTSAQMIGVVNSYGQFGAGVLPPPGGSCNWNTSDYTLRFSTGYNTLADMFYNGNGQYGNGTISTSVFHEAPGSFYSIPANVSQGVRSEVQYDEPFLNPTEGVIEYWVRYEVVIANNGHSLQWHPNDPPGASASPGLWHINGRFVMVNWFEGGNTERHSGTVIQSNHWYNIRCEFKFGSNGYFRLYIDCVLQTGASWTGQVGAGQGQYLKVGWNSWLAGGENSRIYYDELKIYAKNP